MIEYTKRTGQNANNNNKSMFIKYLQLNGEYATNSENNTFRLPYMFAAIQIEQFEINTQQEKLLFIELFTINADVNIISFAHTFINLGNI